MLKAINNNTYMLKLENNNYIFNLDSNYLNELIDTILEIYRTGQPGFVSLSLSDNSYYMILGYHEIIFIFNDNNVIRYKYELAGFLSLLINDMNSIDTELFESQKNQIEKLKRYCYVSEIYHCSDVVFSTLTKLKENRNRPIVIYDKLDNMSSTYRIILQEYSLLIYNYKTISIEKLNITKNELYEKYMEFN